MESGIKTLMLLTSACTDVDNLINHLKESIVDYEKAITKEQKEECLGILEINCALIMTKRIAPTFEDAMELGKRMDENEAFRNLLNGGKDN